jgi:hypothetical protein
MSTEIEFSDPSRPISNGRSTSNIVINDGSLDSSTSLTLLGRKYSGSYTKDIAENFLHLLENFASNNAPTNPERGQLWFNTNSLQIIDPSPSASSSLNTYGLKVYDGTTWLPIGLIKKAAVSPSTLNLESTNLKKGDLYVDTSKNQLYIFNGTGYNLVGPLFNAFEKTGIEVEEVINSLDNQPVAVVSFFIKARRVAVLSDKDFTPKLIYEGFKSFKQGLNLSNSSFDSNTKFWGTSEKAQALLVGTDVIGAGNFLRSDIISTTNHEINIRADNGINIGSDSSFQIGKTSQVSFLYNKNPNQAIELRIKKPTSSDFNSVVRVSGEGGGRVGINKTAPQEALDVTGNIIASGNLLADGKVVAGIQGLETDGPLSLVGDITFDINYTNFDPDDGNIINVGNIIPRQNILQNGDLQPIHELGQPDKKWARLWVDQIGESNNYPIIYGNIIANNLSISGGTGTIDGYSIGFGDPVTIVTSSDSEINFVNATNPAQPISIKNSPDTITIKTELSTNLINSKTELFYIQNTDTFLVQRGTDYYKTTKKGIADSLPVTPTATIILYSGSLSALPVGYLPCDGRELPQTFYQELFNKIGLRYKPLEQLPSFGSGVNTFCLPDLRNMVPNFKPNEILKNLSYVITNVGDTNWAALGLTGTAQVNSVFTATWVGATHPGTGSGSVRLTDGLHYIIYTGKI